MIHKHVGVSLLFCPWQKLNKGNGEESVGQTLGSNPTQKQGFLTGDSIPGFSEDMQLVQTNVQHGVPACPNEIEPYDFFFLWKSK